MREIKYIILHHSATDTQIDKDDIDGEKLVNAIKAYHSKRWSEEYPNYVCDYHFLIGHTGKVFEGQPIEQVSWHATNYKINLESIGICFLGNFEKIKMSMEQFNAGVKLIKDLMKQFNIPLENILRHKDVISDVTGKANSTKCPGKNFPYIHLLDAVRDGEPFFDIGEDYKYINEVKTLKELGIIKGDGNGYFKPNDYITREEAIILVYRVIKAVQK